ncbi:MAG: hypothetical protein ACW99Q_27605 [Candidatus Kariarchaeaceae archaeon]|jgi:hypothetical protein
MTEDEKVKIVNYIVLGAITGAVVNVLYFISLHLPVWFNLGNYNHIDYASQQFFGTTEGNPDLLGFFVLSSLTSVVSLAILGIIFFLLRSRAEWERKLTRFLFVSLLYGIVNFILFVPQLLQVPNLDFIVDGSILFIIIVIEFLTGGFLLYNLEDRFG